MKETLTAPEAARALGVGLNYLYTMLLTGRLAGVRVDGRWQIPAEAVALRLAKRNE